METTVQSNTTANKTAPATEEKGRKKKPYFGIILGVLVALGAVFGIYRYVHGLHHETTDDAQIEANISPVIARTSGYVKELRVDDNQYVHKGDTLVVLDDRETSIRVMNAQAAYDNALASLDVSQSGVPSATANLQTVRANVAAADAALAAARVDYNRATQDLQRYQNLIKDHSVTQREFEQIQATQQAAAKNLERLEQQYNATKSQTVAAGTEVTAAERRISVAQSVVEQRKAELDLAKLQHSYCWITAPEDGTVSRRNVQVGQLMQAGQTAFALVADNEKWVVANFKETQLENVRPGQEVSIEVDAFPGEEFHGKVESFSPATGAKFSLLPPDNATGNFVKIVQRVPVKIVLTDTTEKMQLLRAGMNVEADVHLN
ncbi:membrane fusion protein, multidrug efflux system [Catalinimonas alkaloidigena]|uniref:Membrane fusion protein, multidrug efflux system n=1 Tax=Catalinimonas alkaloidigena TaxID=1075417 RepID=A0A1G8ZVK0_9BACT|nr:HlyD family secretion protein [Catalinimonas alkaloidigena]SDK19098.1 membrane fusion protein, multidrug efflux system [Catalinimonas alkaloidigena]